MKMAKTPFAKAGHELTLLGHLGTLNADIGASTAHAAR